MPFARFGTGSQAGRAACRSHPILAFSDFGFDLPALNIERHVIDFESSAESQGQLFASPELSATGIHAVKESAEHRSAKVAEMANGSDEPWLIWCDTDIEADHLARLIPDAVEVRGSDKIEHKEESLLGFADGKIRVYHQAIHCRLRHELAALQQHGICRADLLIRGVLSGRAPLLAIRPDKIGQCSSVATTRRGCHLAQRIKQGRQPRRHEA